MTRGIRITIDDDEIFEYMKHRKDHLDLSWEEVLYRGIEPRVPSSNSTLNAQSRDEAARGGKSLMQDHNHTRQTDRQKSGKSERPSPHSANRTRSHGAEYATFGFHSDIEYLGKAEDALLRFDALADDSAGQVPIRVILEASTDGLRVTVVAIRRGQDVTELNHFTNSERKCVVDALSRGEPAELELKEEEVYPVFPALLWSTDEDGSPMVVDVEIPNVQLEETNSSVGGKSEGR